MEVEVYADLLFLINAGMDGLCLSMTARLFHRRPRIGRCLLGAAAGGVYAVVALFLSVGSAAALAADAAVCLFMCAVVFGWRDGRGVRGLLAATLLFTVLSMVMGGVMTALFNLCNRAGLADILPDGGEGIGAWLFFASGMVGSIISLRGGRFFRRSTHARLCVLRLAVGERSADVRGLADSGNLLCDPLGGEAVICLSRAAAERVLSPAWERVLDSGGTDLEGLSDRDLRRLRLIPAGTATGHGLLPGFRPDRITLIPEDGAEREIRAVVAVMDGTVAGAEDMGAEAVVPEGIL